MKKFFMKYWPPILILIVWFVFASPFFVRGLVPYSSTYQVNHFAPWSAYNQFWGPVKNGAMPDVTSQIFPWKKLTIESIKKGEIPFWNPYSFSGSPLLANYQSAALTPFNLLFSVFSFIDAWSILVLLQPLLAGIFMYLYLQSLNVSKAGSLISSFAFMFCGFITVWMGYATLGYAILFLPLALFSIEKFYLTSDKRFGLVLAFTLPLSFFSGHFQISCYFLLFVLSYFVYKYLTEKNLAKSKILFLFIISGFLMILPQVLPSIELYAQSLRSTLFQKGEVIPLAYLPTLIAPDFFGNPVTRNDWFGHYAEWSSYIGIVPFMLSIYFFLSKKNSKKIFFLISSFITLLLALDTPLSNLIVVLHIPVLSTSAESRIIVVFSFCLAVAAGLGFDALVLDMKDKNNKIFFKTLILGLIFYGILLTVILLRMLPLEKLQVAKSNLILPVILFVLSAILFYFMKTRNKFIVWGLVALTALDLLRFSTKWQAFDPKNLVFPDVPVSEYFKKISGFDRIYGPFGGEASLYYQLPSVEGYDAVYQQRYGEFMASLVDGKIKESPRSVVEFSKDGRYTPQALNLLGVKYVIHKVSDDHAVWAFPFWEYPKGQFEKIYNDGFFEIYKNNFVLPRAFLVGNYQVETNNQRIINDVFFGENYKNRIVLEENPGIPTTNKIGKVSITSYSQNKISLASVSDDKNILFLSDVFYPGWEVKVDGVKSRIYRADYDFRAVVLDKGRHTIEFTYNPKMFAYGTILAVVGLIVAFYLFLKEPIS